MKVSKDFWVEYESFVQFKKILKDGGKAELKISTTPDSGMDYMETLNISYEIDREVTIKESEFEKILERLHISNNDLAERAIGRSLRYELFGGGENE